MNPFEEIALEEASSAEGTRRGDRKVIGFPLAMRSARNAAHRDGHWCRIEASSWKPPKNFSFWRWPTLLKALVDKGQPPSPDPRQQAIDDDANQTGQMLAALC
ncbi:MAG: hypothetical protein IPK34_18840 [Ramlibacter sp.]|nr:hypothetical protein [Ramlibacter sp.]